MGEKPLRPCWDCKTEIILHIEQEAGALNAGAHDRSPKRAVVGSGVFVCPEVIAREPKDRNCAAAG